MAGDARVQFACLAAVVLILILILILIEFVLSQSLFENLAFVVESSPPSGPLIACAVQIKIKIMIKIRRKIWRPFTFRFSAHESTGCKSVFLPPAVLRPRSSASFCTASTESHGPSAFHVTVAAGSLLGVRRNEKLKT
jgi:hypothetical protein